MTTQNSRSASPNPTPTIPRGALDGASLSFATFALVACGTIGGLVFAAVYLAEGATRPGYDPWQQAISALSLGPGGQVQQVNFVVFGLLALASSFGWRAALRPGIGAAWYPLLRAIAGVGLIVDGFFSQDPAIGYLAGATLGPPTTHGIVHEMAAFVVITAFAVDNFVLARRFFAESRWRGWTLPAVATGLITIAFIALFGATNGHGTLPAGLFERIATGVNTILGLAILARLTLDRRRAPRP